MTAKKTIGDPIDVLLADSNQMQLQLLTGALRRRPEFNVTACSLDRRIHISYPQVPKILVLEALDRELGERFSLRRSRIVLFLEIPFPGIVQMHPSGAPRPDLGNC